MKATDLMIGDYIQSFGEPHKIIGIRTDTPYPYIKTNMSDTWYEWGMKDLADGIPLTPDILEKNFGKPYPRGGFHNYRMEKDETIAFVIEDRRVSAAPDNRVVFCRLPGTYICDVNYVHELQHALKLCRIEKEIVL